jgi:hypothetical protein
MTESPIAEIVTFRARPGVAPARMAELAGRIAPFLAARPGFVARVLSCAEDGTWTDHILWTDRRAAERAAEAVLSEPAAAPFFAAIDEASVRMVHAPVLVHQRAREPAPESLPAAGLAA